MSRSRLLGAAVVITVLAVGSGRGRRRGNRHPRPILLCARVSSVSRSSRPTLAITAPIVSTSAVRAQEHERTSRAEWRLSTGWPPGRPRRRGQTSSRRMSEKHARRRLTIEYEGAATEPRGWVAGGDRRTRFDGWLQLLAALEDALGASTPRAARDAPSAPRAPARPGGTPCLPASGGARRARSGRSAT